MSSDLGECDLYSVSEEEIQINPNILNNRPGKEI